MPGANTPPTTATPSLTSPHDLDPIGPGDLVLPEGFTLPETIDRQALLRSIYRQDPVYWAKNRVKAHYWSKQTEIFKSVRDNLYTAVMSCHTAGKSHISSDIVSWWIDSHEPGEALAMTSAPTYRLVKDVLWRQIRTRHAKYKLPGRTTLANEWIMNIHGAEVVVALGYSPTKNAVSAFVGRHAPYVLIVFDEASGDMGDQIWYDARSMMHNGNCRFLAIGNPEDPTSKFADACQPGSGWNVIQIGAKDTPNFTGEPVPSWLSSSLIDHQYVEDMKRDPGEDHPAYRIKVEGLFPEASPDTLIAIEWIKAARGRHVHPAPHDELTFGVDVGAGINKTTVYARRGGHIRKLAAFVEPDTMAACGRLVQLIQAHRPRHVNIDAVGIGKGLGDRLAEQIATEHWAQYLIQDGNPVEVNLVRVGDSATDKIHYANLRAELWWTVRKAFQNSEVDIDQGDNALMKQLSQMRAKPTSNSKIQIESKDDMRRRGFQSPDEADALMLSYYASASSGMKWGGVW